MYPIHYLVAFGGGVSTAADEVWQCGVRGLPGAGYVDTFDPDTYLDEIQAALSSWFSNADNMMCSYANLQWVKCNQIAADGTYVDPTTHVHYYGTPVAGGTSLLHPLDNSLVMTWGSEKTHGPGTYGRIYPPNSTYTLAGAFTVGDADAIKNATAGKALLTVLNNHSSSSSVFGPCIVSKRNATATEITRVSSDNIYDVQRRRKNRASGARSPWQTFTP